MFEDSGLDDLRDTILVDREGSGSSEEGDEGRGKSSANVSNARSSEKRKSSTHNWKGKKKNISVDRDSSVIEVVAKINVIISPNENAEVAIYWSNWALKTTVFPHLYAAGAEAISGHARCYEGCQRKIKVDRVAV